MKIKDIKVAEDRIRKNFSHTAIRELGVDIAKNSLYHPPVIREQDGEFWLVAGERRLRAIIWLAENGKTVVFDGKEYPLGEMPVTRLSDLSQTEAMEIELNENLMRKDLPWQDCAVARVKIHELKTFEAKEAGLPWNIKNTAKELAEMTNYVQGSMENLIADSLLVYEFLDEKVVQNCKSLTEAKRFVLRRIEGEFLNVMQEYQPVPQREVIKADDSAYHKVHNLPEPEPYKHIPRKTIRDKMTPEQKEAADGFIKLSQNLPKSKLRIWKMYNGDFRTAPIPHKYYPLIIADPPYGIDADTFGDAASAVHDYKDTKEEAFELCKSIFELGYDKWSMDNCRLYLFCDITNFSDLREMAEAAGWKVFRTPLLWVRKNKGHIPWGPNHYKRSYECILYATKGNIILKKAFSDVIEVGSPRSHSGHGAKKPSELYTQLIQHSFTQRNRVLDPCCGSGTVVIAGHEAKAESFGVEIDTNIYNSALAEIARYEEAITNEPQGE